MITSRAVWTLGPVPPPVTGLAVANRAFQERLVSAGLEIIRPESWMDTSPMGSTIYSSISGGERALLDVSRILQSYRRSRMTVVHHHSFAYLRQSRSRKDLACSLACTAITKLGPACHHIFLCNCMRDRFVRRYGIDPLRAHVLNNAWTVPEEAGSDAEDARSWDEIPVLRLGLLSNLSEEKGLFEAVHAGAAILKESSWTRRVTLSLAGPLSKSDRNLVEQLAFDYGLTLEICGPLYEEPKTEWFRGLDLFIFPSSYRNEAYPIVLLEALAAGTPVLTSEIGCTSEIVEGADSCCVVSIDNFRSAGVEHVRELLSRPRANVRRAAREHFEYLRHESERQFSKIVTELFRSD
jgi:glycosyltransferase involved in cell wall biosynthesis